MIMIIIIIDFSVFLTCVSAMQSKTDIVYLWHPRVIVVIDLWFSTAMLHCECKTISQVRHRQ